MIFALLTSAALAAASEPDAPAPAACALAAQSVEAFLAGAEPGVRSAVSSSWLTRSLERGELAALLSQDERERGPDASFAMGYRPDFDYAIQRLTEADIDRFHAALTEGGAILCDGLDTGEAPFTDDLAGFNAWAEGQMMNPDRGAPEGAQSLALSRPVTFDGGNRAIAARAYSYTPIPFSRPPSAFVTLDVYEHDGDAWTHEASIFAARSG